MEATDAASLPQIEMENVAVFSLDKPGAAVLAGVNWNIRPGDYWVIGALPASGKSDLLATAAGLRRPLQGSLRFFGQEANSLPSEQALRERLRVGLVFADGGRLFQQLTVAGNVALPLCYHRDCSPAEAEPQVLAMLRLVGLASLAGQRAGWISRAWRQRAALARALILKPEVLLLDNPLAGLDPRQVVWWLDFLGQLSSGHPCFDHRPVSLAVATDDLRPWLDQGRQFALLKENRWCQVGGRAALAEAAEPLLQELLADTVVSP